MAQQEITPTGVAEQLNLMIEKYPNKSAAFKTLLKNTTESGFLNYLIRYAEFDFAEILNVLNNFELTDLDEIIKLRRLLDSKQGKLKEMKIEHLKEEQKRIENQLKELTK